MISRDRDRVLVAGTVAGLLAKYRVELGGAAELLLGRHEETEREQFRGMVNYEDLVRWRDNFTITEASRLLLVKLQTSQMWIWILYTRRGICMTLPGIWRRGG